MDDSKIRTIQMEEVAKYLECDPRKLRIALRRLSAVPSVIQYSSAAGVCISAAVRSIAPTPEEAAAATALDKVVQAEILEVLAEGPATMEEIYRKINDRHVKAVLADEQRALCSTMSPEAPQWLKLKLNWSKVQAENLGRRHDPSSAGVKCRKCGIDTTRRTHDGPKRGKNMWYAWYFYCPACGWLFMPKEAVRHLDADIAAASPAPTQTDAYKHQDPGDDGRAPW